MTIKRWTASVKGVFRPGAGSAGLRTQRLKIAILSSLAGKSVSVVAQLVALPMAIAALGIERFGMYAMLVALLNWMNMAGNAIAPGLTVAVVAAHAEGAHEREARIVTSAGLFAVVVALAMFALLQGFFQSVGVSKVFGAGALAYQAELTSGLDILSLFLSLSVVLSVVEATQAGYQNQYVNNILGTFGSALSILAIVLVVRHLPSIPNLVLAIYGAPLLGRLVNMGYLFWSRPYLLPRLRHFSLPVLRTILTTGSAFLLTLAGTVCYQSFSVYWAGRVLGAAAAAQMSVMLMVLTLAGSVLMIVTQPLWPAIQDANARHDLNWVRNTCRRLLRTLIPYLAAAAVALAVAGQPILRFWLKAGIQIDLGTQLLWGAYFFLVAWEHINYTVLMGLSQFWFASIRSAAGALVMLLATVLLTPYIGLNGIFLALCLGTLSFAGWLFPFKIARLLRRTPAEAAS